MSPTNYLNAKNGIEILHKDGLTQILAGNGDPSLFGLDASIGSVFLRSDNGGGIYTKITSDLTGWIVTASGAGIDNFLQLLDTPTEYPLGTYNYVVSTGSGIVFKSDYLENEVHVSPDYKSDSDGSVSNPFKTIDDAAHFINTTYSGTENYISLVLHPGIYEIDHKILISNKSLKTIIGVGNGVVLKPGPSLLGSDFIEIATPFTADGLLIDATDNPDFLTTSGTIGISVTDTSFDPIRLINSDVKGFYYALKSDSVSNINVLNFGIYRAFIGVCLASGTLFDADLLYIDGCLGYHLGVREGSEAYIASSEFSSYYEEGMLGTGVAVHVEGEGSYVELFAGTNIWSCNKNLEVLSGGEIRVDNCVLEDTTITPGITQDNGFLTIVNSRAPLSSDDVQINNPEMCYINAFDYTDGLTVIGNGALSDQYIFAFDTGQTNRPVLRYESSHNATHRSLSFYTPILGERSEIYVGANDGDTTLGSHPIGLNALDYTASVDLASIQNGEFIGWKIVKDVGQNPDFYIINRNDLKVLTIDYLGNLRLSLGEAVNKILDESDLISNAADGLPTQRSVKAYVDNYGYSVAQLNSGQLDGRYYTEGEVDTLLGTLNSKVLYSDGTVQLTDDWNVGDYDITALGFNVGNTKVDLASFSNITGVLTGGSISINSIDNTKIDLSAGTSIYTDMTDRSSPIVEILNWDNSTVYPNLSGTRSKWVGIQRTSPGVGTPIFSNEFSQEQKRTVSVIGRCWGIGTDTITGVGNYTSSAFNFGKTFDDLAYTFGSINIYGNKYIPTVSGSLQLSRSAGASFRFNANYGNSNNSPHISNSTTTSGLDSYNYHLQNVIQTFVKTEIDPDNYDLDGVATIVPTDKWTIQMIYYFPVSNITHVVYGQGYHDTFNDAFDYIQDGSYTPVLNSDILTGAILRAYLIIKQGCDDLTDNTKAMVIEVSGAVMGGTSGGSGSISVTSHSSLLNLGDDDHPQYVLVNGSRGLSGILEYNYNPIFNSEAQLVTKKFVDDSVNDLLSVYYTQDQIDTISGSIISLIDANTTLATTQIGRTASYTVQSFWSDVDFDATYYENNNSILEHDLINTSRINIHADGAYFLSYGTVVTALTATTSTYSRILKNGSIEIPASESQIRTYLGEQHELTGSVTMELYDGDYVVLQTYRSYEGEVDILGASFRAVKLDGIKGEKGDKGDKGETGEDGLVTISGSAYFDAYDSLGNLTLTSNWSDVPFDTVRKNSDSFVLNTDTELVIPFSSTYHLTARVTTNITSGTNRSDCKMRVVKDTGTGYVEVPGTMAYTYNRLLGEGTATANVTLIDDFNYDDKIKIQVAQDSGSDIINLLANGSSLSVHIPGGKPGRDGEDGSAGSGSTLIIKDEGSNLPNTPHSSLNFIGEGVSVSDTGTGTAAITIQPKGVYLKEEGTNVNSTPYSTLNFVGELVTVSGTDSNESTINVQTPIFGTGYAEESADEQTLTNSDFPQQKLRLNLTNYLAGNYRIGWYFEWSRDTTSNDFVARIQIDDAVDIMGISQEPKDPVSWHNNSGFYIDFLTSGSHTIDLDYWGQTTNNTSYIRRARLEIWRVS